MKKYTEILSKEERLEMIKCGIVAQLSTIPGIEKDAQLQSAVDRVAAPVKGTLILAALAGVPVGAAWHYLDRRTDDRRRSERELQARLKFYRDIASNIESNLAQQADPDRVV